MTAASSIRNWFSADRTAAVAALSVGASPVAALPAARMWLATIAVALGLGCSSSTPDARPVPHSDAGIGGGTEGGVGTPGGDGGVPPGCPDDAAFFRDAIWPTLSVQCAGCHNAAGLAKTSRLVLDPGGDAASMTKNFEVARNVALVKSSGASVFVLRPSGQFAGGHPGGVLVPQGTAVYADFQRFAERVASDGASCDPGTTATCVPGVSTLGPRQLRRLTRVEYDNTVRDLFGLASEWGKGFPPDDVVDGFDNNAGALTVGALLADKYSVAADEIATAVVKDPSKLAPCASNGDAACAAAIIGSTGSRVFRRPLAATETARYLALYQANASAGFTESIRTVLAAMLESPSFLYRQELGTKSSDGTYALSAYEIASELSYLFWATLPDDELLAAAKSGALTDPAVIGVQAKRLLASPKSRAVFDHFASAWLDLDRLGIAVKDATVYPAYSPDLRDSMRTETLTFFDYVVRTGTGRLPELLTANYSFVDDRLATFYGLAALPASDPNSGTWRKVDVTGAHRGGILTQASILATQAKPTLPSPIHRGKLVRERLLCQKPSPPPPGLNAQLPAFDPSLSNRQRFSVHSQNEPCASCHRLLDPIGFSFENFDGIGHYVGGADTRGEIVASPSTNATFNGPSELGSLLAGSADVEACVALEWFRYATGLTETKDLACLVDELTRAFRSSRTSLPELFVAATQTAHFRQRRADVEGGGSLPGFDGGVVTPPPPPVSDGGVSTPDASVPPSSGVVVTRKNDSQWDKGYCDAVTVTNQGASAVEWIITLTVEGTINQIWNAVAAGMTGDVTVRGVDFNRRLEPGQSASFGFCANR